MKKKLLIVVGTLLVVVIVGLIVLMINLGKTIEKTAETMLPKLTQSPVEIEAVHVHLLRGTVEIVGFVLGNPKGYHSDSCISFGEFRAVAQIRSFFSDEIVIEEIIIKKPEITYELGLGNSNIGTILKNLEDATGGGKEKEEEEPKEDEKPSKKVIIDHFRIEGAKIILASKLTRGIGAPIPLPTIELKNIGRDDPDGVTPVEAFVFVFKKLATSVISVGGKAAAALGKGALAVGGGAVEGVKAVGGGAVEGVKAVGGGVVDGVKAVGGGNVVEGAKAVGGGAVEGVKAVGGGAVEGVKAVGGGAIKGIGGLIGGKKDKDKDE